VTATLLIEARPGRKAEAVEMGEETLFVEARVALVVGSAMEEEEAAAAAAAAAAELISAEILKEGGE
jgi:hypothetical protein